MGLLKEEKDYLKFLVVPVFNAQFNTKFIIEDFDVKIAECNNQSSDYAFEFQTIRDGDSLTIKAFANLAESDTVSPFKLDNERVSWVGSGDEVYTTQVSLSKAFLDSGMNYIRASFVAPNNNLEEDSILLLEEGGGILLEGGGFLVLQEEV